MPKKSKKDKKVIIKNANANSTAPPPLRSNFKYQDRPRHHWIIVEEFGQNGGGCNSGVAKVELKNDPIDRVFFEKRFDTSVMFMVHKEVGLLNQLGDWPGVVKMVDHYIDEKQRKASVYMEYCDAGDLEKVIRDSQHKGKKNEHVHERKVWQWLIELMDTLVYMHRGPEPENDRRVLLYWNSVYHRDIKPGNILLKTDYKQGKVVTKMADFGCSVSAHWTHMTKRGRPEEVSRASALTPGYDPPEFPEYSGATDVWQVALVIACVCTSMISPWSRRNPKGQRWDKTAPAGRNYSQKLNEILAWCLTEDKKRRPTPMEISKRAKVEFAKINLPPDNEPLAIFGLQGSQASHTPQPVSSPRVVFGGIHNQRPEIHPHSFSDPEVQRMELRDRYSDFVHDQRSSMPMASMNELLYRDVAYPPPSLPGDLMYDFGESQFGPGFGPGEYDPDSSEDYFSGYRGYLSDPRHHRRGW